jgi:hypothetical protein
MNSQSMSTKKKKTAAGAVGANARARRSAGRAAAYVSGSRGLPRHPAMNSMDPIMGLHSGCEDPIRLPDPNTERTTATVLRDNRTLQSDANGNLVVSLSTYATRFLSQYATAAGVDAIGAETPTPHAQNGVIALQTNATRAICLKWDFSYIGAELNAAGTVCMTHVNTQQEVVGESMSAISNQALALGRAVNGIKGMTCFRFPPQFTAQSDQTNIAFPVTVIVFTGLPVSTPVIRVSTWLFMEYIPFYNSISEHNASREPHSPSAMSVFANMASAAYSVTSSNPHPGFAALVKAGLNAAYHIAMPVLPQLVPEALGILRTATTPLMLGM